MEIIRSHLSANFDERPDDAKILYLIIHSTECDLKTSLQILTDAQSDYPVSAHYLVAKSGDIYQLVEEKHRAWHAGKDSKWKDSQRLNATSIGIEIENTQGSPFEAPQMKSVLELSKDILQRYKIPSDHVLAHSDIALGRKIDPGPLFDWKWLAENGVGLHPSLNKKASPPKAGKLDDFFHQTEPTEVPNWIIGGITPVATHENMEAILKLQTLLKKIGYGVNMTGVYDPLTQQAVRAFQMKFRQKEVTGEIDTETLDLLSLYGEMV